MRRLTKKENIYPMIVLSIVIPCYNCEPTLKEAVESVYNQDIGYSFEVICVDDCSTDKTLETLYGLQKKYQNLSVVKNSSNLGGGASRNIGIRHSQGRYFFSHDGDNVLVPGTLQKLIKYIQDVGCDGVVIEERKFFMGSRFIQNNFVNIAPQNKISMEYVFEGHSLLIDNFLCSRKAWERSGGYPEHHDFDTQGFEMRFLSTGNTLQICPNTSIFHRQSGKQKSYFEREYERGMLSLNMYRVYEEMFHLFSDKALARIIEYDIFTKNNLTGQNLTQYVLGIYKELGRNFFSSCYKQYQIPLGFKLFISEHKDVHSKFMNFREAVYYYQNFDYKKAISLFIESLTEGISSPIVYLNLLRSEVQISQGLTRRQGESYAVLLINKMQLLPQRSTIRDPLLIKVMRRVVGQIVN